MLWDRLRAQCHDLYGEGAGAALFERLRALIAERAVAPSHNAALTHRDALLITYADQVRAPEAAPLATLAAFCNRYCASIITAIHVLPFYPFTSDDGFAVSDYTAVNPAFGTWDDLAQLHQRFRLMYDLVLNHVSSAHPWFQAFLRDDPRYRDYFIVVEGDPDLSAVVRPRALPLLTPFETPSGVKRVWTTFSADQVDLNYANPEVLFEIVKVMLFYAARGADFLRLDAVAYVWKQIGTTCIHLPQTHRVVQLLRTVIDLAAPHVRLITETNVPHAENIAYFGNGTNEAHLVYNFALPPLVLHTLHTGDARALTQWANTLRAPSPQATFLNFLASHDGIGLNPARGILSQADLETLVRRVLAAGGYVSEKSNPDGTRSPYELNINYLDALSIGAKDEDEAIARFITAHAIMLALVGLPAIYFHSLFGSRGWQEGVRQLGYYRAINREKLSHTVLEAELNDPRSRRARVYAALAQLLRARAKAPAFDPFGVQRALPSNAGVFALLREAPDASEPVLCLTNVTAQTQLVSLPWRALLGTNNAVRDLITGTRRSVHGPSLALQPYQTLWLSPR